MLPLRREYLSTSFTNNPPIVSCETSSTKTCSERCSCSSQELLSHSMTKLNYSHQFPPPSQQKINSNMISEREINRQRMVKCIKEKLFIQSGGSLKLRLGQIQKRGTRMRKKSEKRQNQQQDSSTTLTLVAAFCVFLRFFWGFFLSPFGPFRDASRALVSFFVTFEALFLAQTGFKPTKMKQNQDEPS